MTASHYLIPSIYDAPDGYDAIVAVEPDHIARRLVGGRGNVAWRIRVLHDGQIVEQHDRLLSFGPDLMPDEADCCFVWRGTAFDGGGRPGFIESAFTCADGGAGFLTKTPIGNYALYEAPGRPSFRADGDYKFGSPPVIGSIAANGRLIDGYPVVRLDRSRGYGETLVCLNPYGKSITVSVRSHDGRELPRCRVAPLAGAMLPLEPLLLPEETRWTGRIQITANNRVLLYHLRHRFGDPRNITDHEHLDPYRSDPTHLPLTRWLRQRIGDIASRQFGLHW